LHHHCGGVAIKEVGWLDGGVYISIYIFEMRGDWGPEVLLNPPNDIIEKLPVLHLSCGLLPVDFGSGKLLR